MTRLIQYGVTDNASTNLDGSVGASDLSINVDDGSVFPSTINGSATSAGNSTTLNSTGIQAAGVAQGDHIFNITDGSSAVVKSVTADQVVTTPLQGGTGNTWDNTDEWAVGSFVVTFVQYNTVNDPDSGVSKREKALVDYVSGNVLTINSAGRGFDGSTATTFNDNDNVYLYVKKVDFEGLASGIKDNLDRIDDLEVDIETRLKKDGTVVYDNDTTFKIRNNADSADVDVWKLTTGDIFEFQTLPRNPSSRSISNDYDILDKKYFDDNQPGVETINAGETLTVSGDPLPVHVSDGTNGRTAGAVYRSDVDDSTNRAQKFDGFVDTTTSSGNPASVQTSGLVSGFTGLTEGAEYYLSTTLGQITTDNTGLKVGRAVSSTELLIEKEDKRVAIGNTSRANAAGTGTTTINHNLGVIPRLIEIVASRKQTSGNQAKYLSIGSAKDTSSEQCTWLEVSTGSLTNDNVGIDTTNIIQINAQSAAVISSITEDTVVLNFTTHNSIGSDCEINYKIHA